MVHSDAKSVSIPVQDMSALIARLEAAAGGSQALTDDTLRALGFFTKRYPMDSDRYWIVPGDERHPLPPWCDKITVSLDAALALAERVLPGWNWCVARDAGASEAARFRAWVQSEEGRQANPLGLSSDAASSAALALCISTLRAIHHRYEAAGVVSPNLKAKAQGEGNG